MRRYIEWVLTYRGAVAAMLLVSVVVAAASASRIRVLFQFGDFWNYPGSPAAPSYRQELADFGDHGGYVVAMIETDGVFAPDVLGYVDTLTRELEKTGEFRRVRGLTNVHAIRARGDEVVSGPLLPLSTPPEDRPAARSYALASDVMHNTVVARDGKTTAVLAEMKTPATLSSVAEQRHAVERVRQMVASQPAPAGLRVTVTGAPTVEVGNTVSLIRDQMIMIPAVTIVLMIVLFVMFRSWHGILLCMAAVSTALVWTAGIFSVFHRPVDIIGSVIPITILSYGAVDPIFVLSRVLGKVDHGMAKRDAIVATFSELAIPCFLTSLTTSLAFLAFVTARAPTMRFYGVTVGIGVLLAWVTTVTVLPVLLAYAPLPKGRFDALSSTRWLEAGLRAGWSLIRGRVGLVSAAAVLLLLAGAAYGRVQRLNNTYVDSLPNGQSRREVHRLQERLAGVMRLDVRFEGARDDMKRPNVLAAIDRINAKVRQDAMVSSSIGLPDLLAEVNQAFLGGDPTDRVPPRSSNLVAQYLALIDPQDRADVVSDDQSTSRLAILVRDSGSRDMASLVQRIRRWVADEHFDALSVRASVTGLGVAAYGELDETVLELLQSFVTGFLVIVGLEWLILRSLRIALISVVPNLIPVVACFALLRVLHMDLAIDSGLVLCVAIGGLFNTTIHLAACVQQQIAKGEVEPDAIMVHALRTVGPASFLTAVSLSAGFSVLLLSSFPGLQTLGLLSVVTLSLGFFSDMTVSAALLRLFVAWPSPRDVRPRAAAPRVGPEHGRSAMVEP